MSKPKPKSVDECWMIEVKPGKFYIPVIIRKTKKSAETRKRGEIFPSRIRKWRAETVCEWREISKIDMQSLKGKTRVKYVAECGKESAFLATDCAELGFKYCPHCGGKIRVKK